MLKDWKAKNNVIERCDVHHRDDTEECIKYNSAHYELWGFNEDGTFEYGKYVVFMTHAEHSKYHHIGSTHASETKIKMSVAHKGDKNPMYGKHHSNEFREKMHARFLGENNAFYGKHHSAVKFLYETYKNNGGSKKWNEFQKALKNGDITFEMQPITVFTK